MTKRNTFQVKRERILQLNGSKMGHRGPVIYWMSRDQRVNDNWAFLYSAELAAELDTTVVVVFALTDSFLGASLRHYGFMLKGLMEAEKKLLAHHIPFTLLTGDPPGVVAQYAKDIRAGAIVTDFDPLKIKKTWKKELAKKIDIPLFEVDAHNVVPCRIASDKPEFGAYTLRPKLKKKLEEYLEEFPELPSFAKTAATGKPAGNHEREIQGSSGHLTNGAAESGVVAREDWHGVQKQIYENIDTGIGEVEWIKPGEDAAALMFSEFTARKLSGYNDKRNDPNASAVSDMSPYLHFGQISAQRMALEILKNIPENAGTNAYLEELIVRKELSDNFCHFNDNYDSFQGFPDWAKTTLNAHRKDEREYLYNKEQFETANTHDKLWNAAQTEMVKKGKMHGYMRMYWAKKILEWSPSPEEALDIAIFLNDKYELDGRDPNGYTGCAWSIGGVHDRAWGERPVSGKIRYMNANGAGRKFDTRKYINTYL
ncbi:MAG: deoxyribodipyrimidine photo-lyase [Bacteroidales bacterium]